VKSVLLVGTGSIVTATGQVLSVLFLTYFLLAAGDLFRRKLVHVVGPSLTNRKTALKILNDIHALNQRYFAVVLAINIIIGIVTGIALRLLGLDHALVWGAVAAVLHMIPYLGVALLAAIVALDAYVQFSTLQMALVAGVIPIAISFVLGVWLQAVLMARAARMNAPVVFISLLFWGMLWGAWGLLLAMPIMATLKTIFDHIESLNKFGDLLGEENKE
jgi:predicted PurR-regulated permease PerM